MPAGATQPQSADEHVRRQHGDLHGGLRGRRRRRSSGRSRPTEAPFSNIAGQTGTSLTRTAVAGRRIASIVRVGDQQLRHGDLERGDARRRRRSRRPLPRPARTRVNAVATGTNGAIVNFAATATDECGAADDHLHPEPRHAIPNRHDRRHGDGDRHGGQHIDVHDQRRRGLPFDRCVRQGTTGNYFRCVINPPAGSESLKGYWEFHTVVGATDTLVASGTANFVANLPNYQVLQQYGPSGNQLNANINTGAGVTQIQLSWNGTCYTLLDFNVNDGGCP